MRIDLHTHSSVSDGTDSPSELVRKARAAGLDVIAITDHDITAGWGEALAAGEQHGIRIVTGIEISTRNNGQSQHLLGYGFDADDAALGAVLAKSRHARVDRVRAMAGLLAEKGKPIETEPLIEQAGAGAVGRPHIASAMVAKGYVDSVDEAFAQWLGNDKPAYIPRFEPDMEEVIPLVRAAGGVTVVAHPQGRGGTVTDERFSELRDLGLNGVEVDHEDHDPATREHLRGLAAELGLAATGSSDYHGDRKTFVIGCNTTDPDQFEQLMAGVRRDRQR